MNIDDVRRLRDAIQDGLLIRKGLIITDEVARERANNLSLYLEPIVDDIVMRALIEAARGTVVTGEIGGLDVAVGTVRAPVTNEGSEDE